MQFNFFRGSRQRLLRFVQKIGVVGMMLAAVSVSAGTSSISQRDIFVGASARAVGMGSAFTAGPSATNGFLWNPSSLGFMDGVEVNMGGMPFPGNFSSRDQAFSVAANPQTFGVTNRNLGNVSFATWLDGWKNDTIESTQIVLLGYGLALGQRASAGANLRYYQNNTSIRTNFLWSVDLGMQFAYPLQKWGDSVKLGVNFSELSRGIRENGVLLESAPLAARFGTTYEVAGNTLFSADLAVRGQNDANWGERLRLHFGAEHWFIDGHIGLRFGYTALTASERFWSGELARGLSFRNSAGQLDYAYVSGSELEQGVHWISATLRWGEGDMIPVSVATTRTEVSDVQEAPAILMPATLEINPETIDGALNPSESAISPNDDGVSDSTTFRLRLGENGTLPLRWQLNIFDEYTESIWEKSGTGVPVESVVWDGTTDTGNLVPDGNYEVRLYVLDPQGTQHFIDTETVTVDLIPTTLELFAKTPTTIGVKAWDINPLTHWKLELFDARNTRLQHMEGEGSPPSEVILSEIQVDPNAIYTCKLHVQDIAGNQSTEQTQLQFGMSSQRENPTASKLTLMVGSFVERSYAEAMAERLRLQNPNQTVALRVATVDAQTVHRVTIGEFSTRAESTALKQRIQETLKVEPVLIMLQ